MPLGAPPLRGEPADRANRAELLGVGAAAVLVGAWLARLAWIRHASLQTNTYDFGLFVNAIWNTAQGRIFEADEVAYQVLCLCDPRARGITAQSLVLDGGGVQT